MFCGVRWTTRIAKITDTLRSIWRHPANEGKRVRAVIRAVNYQVKAKTAHKRLQAKIGDHSVVWVDPHRSGAVRVVYANPPDYPEMQAWRKVLDPGDMFIDIGANIGAYSIWVAELGVKVIALEPAPDTFQLLQENISLNNYNIVAVNAAAGASCGERKFTSGKDTLNRFDPLGPTITSVITIDSLVGDSVIAGIKIDVEGFEMDVLRGSECALSEHRIRMIQLEWNHACLAACGTDRQPVADFLTNFGYALYRPTKYGDLLPLAQLDFGPDVFACLPF
jgi:FkbM family methyltransferase